MGSLSERPLIFSFILSPEGASSAHSLHHTKSNPFDQQCLANVNWNQLFDLFQSTPSIFELLQHGQLLFYSNVADLLLTFHSLVIWCSSKSSLYQIPCHPYQLSNKSLIFRRAGYWIQFIFLPSMPALLQAFQLFFSQVHQEIVNQSLSQVGTTNLPYKATFSTSIQVKSKSFNRSVTFLKERECQHTQSSRSILYVLAI